ncbi:MAG: hypothetical protein ACYTG5_10245 [Planctomycetota bacterium]|jgi:hypothetical protein
MILASMSFMWFVIPLVIALVVVGAIYAHKKEKERREALAELARSRGWTFSPDKDHGHDEDYAHFEVFRSGHSRYAYNTMQGPVQVHGRDCFAKAGDFHYRRTTGSGKNRRTSTHRFSYLILHLPYASSPDLIIRREGLFDKLKGVFGFDDIDFESEEFSRKFYVQSPDKRFAYDVCHPRMLEFLLAESPGLIDIENGRCCVSGGYRRWKPEQFEAELDFLLRFLELWPEHLTSELT